MPSFSHLTSYTLTKSNLYLANSLATVVSGPNLCSLITILVSNFMSLFNCLGCTTGSVQVQGNCECFIIWYFFMVRSCAPHPTPRLEFQPLSAVHDCLFNILAAALHVGGHTSIRNLTACHAMVTGTHIWFRRLLVSLMAVTGKINYINLQIRIVFKL